MNSLFTEQYRCFSLSFHEKVDKEDGDKIVLPQSALQKLLSMNVQYPMQFELKNENIEPSRRTHVGILEFTAPEGQMFIPYWIMQSLLLEEYQLLTVCIASLPLATFVKFKPQSVDFLEIVDPKTVLEIALMNFSCLTKGDQICLIHNCKNYFVDIVELKPADSVSIIEVDLEVDFEEPVGYIPYFLPPATQVDTEKVLTEQKPSSFTGIGRRLDDKVAPSVQNEESVMLQTESRTSKWKTRTKGSVYLGTGKKLGF